MGLDIDFYRRLASGLVRQFGDRCEVLLIQAAPEKSFSDAILFIENPKITGGRIAGSHWDTGSHPVKTPAFMAWQSLLTHGGRQMPGSQSPDLAIQDVYGQTARTDEGKIIKYSLIYIRDPEIPRQIAAILAIHWDITDLVSAKGMLDTLICAGALQKTSAAPKSGVEEFLEDLILQAEEHIGKPAAVMNRHEKICAIRFLNDAGAFLIQKSGDRISKHFGISKYTLYSYIDAGKNF